MLPGCSVTRMPDMRLDVVMGASKLCQRNVISILLR